jgi:bis(5'-nucleosyl)-tetraphosphatase (symmetrical)
MTVYAISDVQGCQRELESLLERIAFDAARDRLWFVGDLVNRGPDSLAVLRFVRKLGKTAVTVLGNHDLHLLAVAAGAGRGLRANDTIHELLAAPDRDELLDWLRHRPLVHHDRAVGFAMVHAGLPPQWTLAQALELSREFEAALAARPDAVYAEMYGDQPDRWSDDLSGGDRLRFIVNCCTRLRFCDPSGRLNLKLKVAPEAAQAPWIPWFEAPGRRTAAERIVTGHWSALGLKTVANVWCIDSGCVWGGRLTALELGARPAVIQVPCRGSLKVGED